MPRPAVSGLDQARSRTAYVLTVGLLGLAVASPAAAQSPGGAEAGEPTETKPAPPTGGAVFPGAPRITALRCRTRCAGPADARPGATLDLRGRAIRSVESVVFLGEAGATDDVTVAPRRVTRKRILVNVPRLAHSGPVAVVNADGAESPPTAAPLTVSPAAPGGAPAEGAAIDVELQDSKVFVDGVRQATLAYVLRHRQPATVTVELLRSAHGVVIASWAPGVVAPDVPQTVTWDGTVAGQPQPPGRYEFRVTARDDAGGQATSASSAAASAAPPAAPAVPAFDLLDHRFPIRGAHSFGTGAAAFGGGRGHQGHDVFAVCGTPLVAARGGRVKFKQYHSRAGNYIVVDGEQTDVDYAYMHLRDAALVDEGDRIRTGQLIGYVGDTGRADGCHLHFELWGAPGWYDGGAALDPLPHLRAWDATS